MKDNILIAKFMGWTWSKEGNGKTYLMNPRLKPEEIIYSTRPEQLLFHKSWDWLMPVVEKIWSIIGNRESIFYFQFYNFSELISASHDNIGKDHKYDCWLAVVKFIKWYNKQKKK